MRSTHLQVALATLVLALVACADEKAAPKGAAPGRSSANPARSERVPTDTVRSGPAARPVPTARPGPAVAPDPASLAVIREAAASVDIDTRIMALEAIAEARLGALGDVVDHALGDPEHDVRVAAVEALRAIPTGRSRSLLASVRDDQTEDLDIRALAASALLATQP